MSGFVQKIFAFMSWSRRKTEQMWQFWPSIFGDIYHWLHLMQRLHEAYRRQDIASLQQHCNSVGCNQWSINSSVAVTKSVVGRQRQLTSTPTCLHRWAALRPAVRSGALPLLLLLLLHMTSDSNQWCVAASKTVYNSFHLTSTVELITSLMHQHKLQTLTSFFGSDGH